MARTEAYIKIASEEQASTGATGALPLKTGQTTSYATGDDGGLQEGRNVDFFTLSSNNPFGNTDRFTDELGSSTYANDIIIDWSTYNGAEVLGVYRTLITNGGLNDIDWTTCLTTCNSLTVGTFSSGWRMWNRLECANFIRSTVVTRPLNYAPFNFNSNLNMFTSTTEIRPDFAICMDNLGGQPSFRKTLLRQTFAVRNFTVTGSSLQAAGIPAGGASSGSGGSFGLPGGTIGGTPGGAIGGTIGGAIGGAPGTGITLT